MSATKRQHIPVLRDAEIVETRPGAGLAAIAELELIDGRKEAA